MLRTERKFSVVPSVFTRSERTEDERDYIKSVLSSNVLFQDVAATEGRWSQRILNDLAAAFYKVEYKEGDVIFSQGDADKDFMLILEQGECQITIDGKEIVSSLTSMLWLCVPQPRHFSMVYSNHPSRTRSFDAPVFHIHVHSNILLYHVHTDLTYRGGDSGDLWHDETSCYGGRNGVTDGSGSISYSHSKDQCSSLPP